MLDRPARTDYPLTLFTAVWGAVSSESVFSTDWLACCECYVRSLRFKQANPSVVTLAICAIKMQRYASCMTLKNSHKKLSQRFTQLQPLGNRKNL